VAITPAVMSLKNRYTVFSSMMCSTRFILAHETNIGTPALCVCSEGRSNHGILITEAL
jgi:hypothetical protein